MIIGISGNKRVGKDTVGRIITANFGAERFALADPIKNIILHCSKYSSIKITEDQINGFPDYDREQVEDWNSEDVLNLLNKCYISSQDSIEVTLGESSYARFSQVANQFVSNPNNFSIRKLMQVVGTDIGVNIIDKNIWVNLTKMAIDNSEKSKYQVITDLRQQHEFDFVKEQGGYIIHIEREDINKQVDYHITETNLGFYYNDIIIHNNESLLDLQKQVLNLPIWSYK
jgi:hypothetical protein